MADLVADTDNIWHGGRKLCDLSEEIEDSVGGMTSSHGPSESAAGAASEQGFIRSWGDLKFAQQLILRTLLENLDELGTAVKEQSEKYAAADAATVEDLNNVDYEGHLNEMQERESSRDDIRVQPDDDRHLLGYNEDGSPIYAYS